MRRETLIKNLEAIVGRIDEEDLPVPIKEIYVFGSFIRGKEDPHDLDTIFIWDADEDQWQKVVEFQDNFRNIYKEGMWDKLIEFHRDRIPFPEATREMAKELEEIGVNPSWASCFS